MTEIRDTLQAAIDDGEVLTVIYHGGSQPGIPRQLAPIQLMPGDKLRARCIATNTAKVFVVSKIQVIESADAVQGSYSTSRPVELTSITEAIEKCLAEILQLLRQQGWHIHVTEDEVSVRRIGKNGRPTRKSVLSLEYHLSGNIAIGWDEDTSHVTLKNNFPRERPWVVSGAATKTVSYRNLSKAVERFIQAAEHLQSS